MLIEPVDQWLAVTPEVFSEPGARSADLYIRCIEQFHVDTHARYKRNANGNTMCNIFAQDVVNYAMKTPCPHWVDITTQAPLAIGPNGLPLQKTNRTELSGNGICKWLQTIGCTSYGWKKVSPQDACAAASLGQPSLVTWYNPGGIGHIAVVRPSTYPDLRIAQAGASNFINGVISDAWGHNPTVLGQLVYVTHA